VTYTQGANFSRILKSLTAICLFTIQLLWRYDSDKWSYPPKQCMALLKITQLSVHAQNHVSIERCRKSFTTVVLGDDDFAITASNFGNVTAFRAFLATF